MKKIAIAAAIGAAMTATPALAQEDTSDDMGGIKVGVVGGYDVISLEVATDTERESGVVYGLTAGWDIDTGDTIIGIEAEVSDTSISDDFGDAGLDIYGGLRLGLQVGEEDLIYLKAGYSNVDIELADNLEGARVGVGYERSFGGVFGRLEYRYTTYNVSDVIAPSVNGNRNQVVLTLGGSF
ncbi:MAG: hypothetical protein HKO08_06470 [Erythrobacter sp.]|nr:hypothetical protein [Erythrobacter sp.]